MKICSMSLIIKEIQWKTTWKVQLKATLLRVNKDEIVWENNVVCQRDFGEIEGLEKVWEFKLVPL